jgi:RNA-binding protein YhbY
MTKSKNKKTMSKSEYRAFQVMAETTRLLNSAKETLHAAVNISRDGLTKQQRAYIKKSIKEDGEFKIEIKRNVELIGAFAHGALRNLIDRELPKV